MTVAFVMLVHDALDRAAQVARHWAERDCPVVIHVDRRVPRDVVERFRQGLSDLDNIRFSPRFRCEWGTWALVAAAQAASEIALRDFPRISHVYLASGSCLPLRPVDELKRYLARHADTDFIESVTIEEVPWTVGGLDTERFTLTFPFAWKTRRWRFDAWVALQRAIGYRRGLPEGIVPHLGSQWWCLTRQTLEAILASPRRAELERFFRRVWIPDESYFQTVVRSHARRIESRSLTLSKFDYHGKPHVFHDDHLQLLRRSDCFVARKVWPGAEGLYTAFLSDVLPPVNSSEPDPGQVDRVFSWSTRRRSLGRRGLVMAGRFPNIERVQERTAAPYSVLSGLDCVVADLPRWLEDATEMRVHGHLFAPSRVEFAEGQACYAGALSDHAALRDYDPAAFLRNLVWNTRGERQAFSFGPADRQDIAEILAEDSNAHLTLVTGAWIVPLFQSGRTAAELRGEAARLQSTEASFASMLRAPGARARVRILTLAEMTEQPMEVLQDVIDEATSASGPRLAEVPHLVDLTGIDRFIQDLRNLGMNPYLVGDLRAFRSDAAGSRPSGQRPYLVQ
ncbi:MAG: beta-1,6-N-acetylglucosaminyltransferase [Rhodobacteraceae bacterium]|nr:beta-1,6-N-acetylglucosaminyltransferase [Paracoccaceae bacterium]